jgi:PAS domain S-box-containing protein
VEYSVEARVRARTGTFRWMLIRAVPFRDGTGTIIKWMGTSTDIHDIRQSAEAVRLSEERFRLLARASNDAICDLDLDTGRIWWSENFESLFGFRPSESVRSFEDLLDLVHDDDRSRVRQDAATVGAADSYVWQSEFRLKRRDGRYARVLARGYVIRDGSGRARRMVGGLADITQRAQLEEQLRQAQRLESVGQLTGGVAHDFNNLLTVIIGNAEVLEEELDDHPELAAMAQMIFRAAERGADLTQRLLAFARRQPLDPVPVDVRGQLRAMEPLLRRTLGEHIHMDIVAAPDMVPALVDAAQLDSAVLNLCLNARDAMAGGGRLRIEASVRELDEAECRYHVDVVPGTYIALVISDTGTGIDPADMPHVFEPFFTTKERGKGTGLGLAMVYGFAKQSGGDVTVRSEPGAGTTLTIYLPATARPVSPSSPAREPGRDAARGECVLLVEDDEMVRRYAQEQLAALGYRVIVTESGAAALEVLRGDSRVDLLFTDVVMGGMSGPQLATEAAVLRPGLPVLYTSGYTENAIVHHGRLDAGVQLLPKPYRREELAQRIRAALAKPAAGSRP